MRNIEPDSEENQRATRENNAEIKRLQYTHDHPFNCPLCNSYNLSNEVSI